MLAEQLLLILEFWREYRTLFHLAGKDIVWSAVLIAVAEVPYERPKKTKGIAFSCPRNLDEGVAFLRTLFKSFRKRASSQKP